MSKSKPYQLLGPPRRERLTGELARLAASLHDLETRHCDAGACDRLERAQLLLDREPQTTIWIEVTKKGPKPFDAWQQHVLAAAHGRREVFVQFVDREGCAAMRRAFPHLYP